MIWKSLKRDDVSNDFIAFGAFSSEVDTASGEENASKQGLRF